MKKVVKSKVLIAIQVNLVPIPSEVWSTNLPELLLLKILPLSYHHSHFWAAILDFTTSFMLFFLDGPHLFLKLGCFCVDNFYMAIINIKTGGNKYMAKIDSLH